MNTQLTEQEELDSVNEYEQNQIEAEKIVLRDAAPGLPLVTVLRPGPIYGPGCKGGIASIATLPPLVKSLGPHYLPFSGGPKINMVHAEDVARAAVFLLLHPRAFSEVFNLGDNTPMPFGAFINIAMENYGLEPLGPGVPYPPGTLLQSILPYLENDEIFSPLSRVGTLLWERMIRKQKLKATLDPQIDPETLSSGARDLLLDCGKLLGLGFKLKHPTFQKGWGKTMAWYVNQSWIPRPEAL
jgi:nucleoside-diphosphate-sugar epimerase